MQDLPLLFWFAYRTGGQVVTLSSPSLSASLFDVSLPSGTDIGIISYVRDKFGSEANSVVLADRSTVAQVTVTQPVLAVRAVHGLGWQTRSCVAEVWPGIV
jgi:hypothetical protein